jgi:hypothetical protein
MGHKLRDPRHRPLQDASSSFRNTFLSTRFARSSGWWWIDQISIDQGHIAERSQQVTVMPKIYRRARKVIIWLDNLSKVTMEALNLGLLNEPYANGHDSRRIDKNRQVVRELSSHAYWSRVWTVQEVVLARNVDIVYTSGSLPLAKAQQIVARLDDRMLAASSMFKWFIQNATNLGQTPPRYSHYRLDHMVQYFSNAGCSDLRDKVFGIQGLLKESKRIRIDYSKTVEQVLLDAVEQIIRDWPDEMPFRYLLSTCLKLGEGMLPKGMVLHNMFDRLEPFNMVFRSDEHIEEKKIQLLAAFRTTVVSFKSMT